MYKKLNVKKNNKKADYPSAKFLLSICYDEYKMAIDFYDKLNTKIQMILVFCSGLLLVIINNADYTNLIKLFACKDHFKFLVLLVYCICSALSLILIMCVIISLLVLLKGQQITIFDSNSIINEKLYEKIENHSALWIIDRVSKATLEIKKASESKNRRIKSILVMVIISLITFSIAQIIKKGM